MKFATPERVRWVRLGIIVALVMNLTFGQRLVAGPQDHWTYTGTRYDGQYNQMVWAPNGLLYAVRLFGYMTTHTAPGIDIFNENLELQGYVDISSQGFAPVGLAADRESNIICAFPDRIAIFATSGQLVRSWGGMGSDPGQFDNMFYLNGVNAIAVDSNGLIYVADPGNNRIQVFDSEGNFLRQWGEEGELIGQILHPVHIAISPLGEVCVTSAELGGGVYESTQVFDVMGSFKRVLFRTFDYLNQFDPFWGASFTNDGLMINTLDAFTSKLLVHHVSGELISDSPVTLYKDLPPDKTDITFNETIHDYFTDHYYLGIAPHPNGNLYVSQVNAVVDGVKVFTPAIFKLERQYSQVDNTPSFIPLPNVVSAAPRANSTLIDIDYVVRDADSATVDTAVFVKYQGDLIPLQNFQESTGANVGRNVAANTTHRVTWDASEVVTTFADLEFEVWAKDDHGLLSFHFLEVPEEGMSPAFKISRDAVPNSALRDVWRWLVAIQDPGIRVEGTSLYGTAGVFANQLLAVDLETQGDGSQQQGRQFLYERVGVRKPTADEISRASSGIFAELLSADALHVVKAGP